MKGEEGGGVCLASARLEWFQPAMHVVLDGWSGCLIHSYETSSKRG